MPDPLVLRSFRTLIKATLIRKTTAHAMAPWKHKPLDQMMLFDPEVGLSIKGGNVAGRQGGGMEIINDES
jgi:hypothetical protein